MDTGGSSGENHHQNNNQHKEKEITMRTNSHTYKFQHYKRTQMQQPTQVRGKDSTLWMPNIEELNSGGEGNY